MKNLTSIINLLGEENEKKLRDGITDLLLKQVEEDLNDKYEYEYILAFDDIYEEAKQQIEEEFKQKLVEKYRKQMDESFKNAFGE